MDQKFKAHDSVVLDDYEQCILDHLIQIVLPQLRLHSAPRGEVELLTTPEAMTFDEGYLNELYRSLLRGGLQTLTSRIFLSTLLATEHVAVLRERSKSWFRKGTSNAVQILQLDPRTRQKTLICGTQGVTGINISYPEIALLHECALSLSEADLPKLFFSNCSGKLPELHYLASILETFPRKHLYRAVTDLVSSWTRLEIHHLESFDLLLDVVSDLCTQNPSLGTVALLTEITLTLTPWSSNDLDYQSHKAILQVASTIQRILRRALDAPDKSLRDILEDPRDIAAICKILFCLAKCCTHLCGQLWNDPDDTHLQDVFFILCRVFLLTTEFSSSWAGILTLENEISTISSTLEEMLKGGRLKPEEKRECSIIMRRMSSQLEQIVDARRAKKNI